jgi:hypothetical protein
MGVRRSTHGFFNIRKIRVIRKGRRLELVFALEFPQNREISGNLQIPGPLTPFGLR